ncbi:MAG: response regulator [Alphaproteobacteria bacterium]|nr:response regulator [Alphaproteobacteria bacterium]
MVGRTAPKYASKTLCRIVIVEDEAIIRMAIAEAARDLGYQVIEAGDADATLDYLASGQRVDLVFTDIQLPGSIDGLELARQLKRRYPNLKVLLTSGRLAAETAQSVAPFIPKPYPVEEALVRIAETLTSQPSDA